MSMPTHPEPQEPIVLEPPRSDNKARFEEERLRVAIGLGKIAAAIEHIGSTAIAGIRAKPIIDMLVGMRALPLTTSIAPFQALGYEYMESPGDAERLVFKIRSPRAYHAHVVLHDGSEWRRHVIFRDWLNLHPQWAQDYEALKVELAGRFANDRAAYTEGKTEFVERALLEAAKFPALRLRR